MYEFLNLNHTMNDVLSPIHHTIKIMSIKSNRTRIIQANESEFNSLLFHMLSLSTPPHGQQEKITNMFNEMSGHSENQCSCCGQYCSTTLYRFGLTRLYCKRCIHSQQQIFEKTMRKK